MQRITDSIRNFGSESDRAIRGSGHQRGHVRLANSRAFAQVFLLQSGFQHRELQVVDESFHNLRLCHSEKPRQDVAEGTTGAASLFYGLNEGAMLLHSLRAELTLGTMERG